MPELCSWLQQNGGVADTEMHRVFNCGIGMVIVVGAAQADTVAATLASQGETVSRIGEIVAQKDGEGQTVVVSGDRKSVVQGKSVSVRVDLGGRRIMKNKTPQFTQTTKIR